MRILNRIAILILIFFYVSQIKICAQVIERSENKVIVSGVAYYIHIVKKGETAYAISRAYGIKLEDVTKENPSAVYGISEGQSLRIPVDLVEQADKIREQQKPKDEENYIYHVIRQNETIYALSRIYNVSEDDIKQSNEDIDITKISIGTEIAIPRKQLTTNSQNIEANDKGYIYHTAQRGESLASIARRYNITARELRRENPGIIFLQAGTIVRIPGQQVYVRPEITTNDTENEIDTSIIPEIPTWIERPFAPTSFARLSGKINVAVLLPFYFGENSNGTVNNRRRPDDWLFPESIDFIEMYEGILLAIDTLRAMGLDINLYPHDIQDDSFALSRLIQSGELSYMDLIIGPVYSNNLRIVAEYARDFDIPVVSPVPLFNSSILEGNPNLFMANPTLEVAQNALAKKIAEYHDHNFIFIHADSLGMDADVNRFREVIMNELYTNSPSGDIRFREMRFLSRAVAGNSSRLVNALSNQTGNVVIIASEYAPVISETITDAHTLSRRFDIKVFGYPLLRELENLVPQYFFDLDMLLYSTYWIDYTKPNVKQFNANFRTTFFTQPPETSFAWKGYDIAYFFISGLALYGKDLLKYPYVHRPELLHTDFYFVRRGYDGGFENQKLFPIRYTKDFNVILDDYIIFDDEE